MTTLDGIWESIKVTSNVKTLRFDNPEEATDYLKEAIKNIDSDIWFRIDDEEIGKDEILERINVYWKSQDSKLYFELVKGSDAYIVVTFEYWEMGSDYDCYANILTFSKW